MEARLPPQYPSALLARTCEAAPGERIRTNWAGLAFVSAWLLGPIANAIAILSQAGRVAATLQVTAWTSLVALALTAGIVLGSAKVRERMSFQLLLGYWLGVVATLPAFDSHVALLQRHASAFLIVMPLAIPLGALLDQRIDRRASRTASRKP